MVYGLWQKLLQSNLVSEDENRKFYITSNWSPGQRLFKCVINDKTYSVQIEKEKDACFIVVFI